jgi:hypothetical protein
LQEGNAFDGHRPVDYTRSIVSTILDRRNRITCGPDSRPAIAIQGDPTSITNKFSSETVDEMWPIVERSEGIENGSESCTLLDWRIRAITCGRRGARRNHTRTAIVTEFSGVRNSRNSVISDFNDSEGDSGG